MHLAYLAAGLKKGDEVIVTPNTFVATANMLLSFGAIPKFCDIRIDTYNIDEDKIEKLINGRTEAIVPVHFSGQPCKMDKISKIAKKYQLKVIEDACHALGAKYLNSKIGSCRYSDMAVFSFHPVKGITTGEGGAILTNNKKYYEKLILLRSHGIHKDKASKNIMTELGYNYRMTDFQSALGLSQLRKLNRFIKIRRRIVGRYKKELQNIKQIILPFEAKENYSSWHIYVVRTSGAADRDRLVKYLKARGIGVNYHYPAVYFQPYYRKNGYKNLSLKNEEIYQNSCLTLPCFPGLKQAEVKYVGDRIKSFYA